MGGGTLAWSDDQPQSGKGREEEKHPFECLLGDAAEDLPTDENTRDYGWE